MHLIPSTMLYVTLHHQFKLLVTDAYILPLFIPFDIDQINHLLVTDKLYWYWLILFIKYSAAFWHTLLLKSLRYNPVLSDILNIVDVVPMGTVCDPMVLLSTYVLLFVDLQKLYFP